MENNYTDFKNYRAKLRYKYFNNNKYLLVSDFCDATCAFSFWDINFFANSFHIPCATDHMESSTFETFLKNERIHPTINWTDIFNYYDDLQKHPYLQNYLGSHTNDSGSFIRDALSWSILEKYRNALTEQIQNNQQLWF